MNTYDLIKRRNLLIISIILFLISFSEVELGNNVSFSFGIKISIKDPIVIYIIIWAMYIYFFIRFFQCLLDEENDNAKHARELVNLVVPPFYVHDSNLTYNTYIRKIRIVFIFIFTYIERLIIFIVRTLFGKSFLEYIFPLLFALFVGISSYYSPFMKTKKEYTHKLISEFWCSAKHKAYERFLPEYLKSFEIFMPSCSKSKS